MARKFLPVPFYPQPVESSHCGTASLRMVLAYHGVHVPHRTLLRELRGHHGVYCPDLVYVAREHGMRAYTKNHLTINGLISFIDEGIPVILRTRSLDDAFRDEPDIRHLTVAYGYDTVKRRIYTNDPAFTWSDTPMDILSFADLKDIWTIEGTGNKRLDSVNKGIIITPR